MIFKKKLPLIVCFIVGILTLLQYYVPNKVSIGYLETMTQWDIIISAFAFLLGLASLFAMHYDKIRRKTQGWGYSLFMFGGVILGLTCGIISKANQTNQEGFITAFGWIYNYVLNPLQGTMFALLAFYVVSASFRAFRVKSGQAFILFLAAVIILFGRVPLGQLIWSKFMSWLPFGISEAIEWIMNFPSTAARRGIMIGIALGAVAMSLKIIFGIEKQYLGGKE